MSSLFDRMFGRKTEGSSSKAKDRLQFVLVHDRINLPPERMQEMKEEILAVISKYVTVDRGSVDIALEQRDNRNSKLVAEIPVMQSRTPTAVDEDDDLRAKPKTNATTTQDKSASDTAKETKEDVKPAADIAETSQAEDDKRTSIKANTDNEASTTGTGEETSATSSDDTGSSDAGGDSD